MWAMGSTAKQVVLGLCLFSGLNAFNFVHYNITMMSFHIVKVGRVIGFWCSNTLGLWK